MPTIDTKNKKIIYDEKDWLSGLNSFYGSRTIPQKFGQQSRQQYAFNPFDDVGYAKNAFLNTDFAHEDRVTSRILKVIYCSGGTNTGYYGIDAANKLYGLTLNSINSDVWSGVNLPLTIGASTVNSDICTHFAGNSKVNAVFVSYNVAAGGDVAVYSLDDATSDLDYMSTRPSGGTTLNKLYPHPMCVGHDDTLYIGNGRSLYCYDYSDTADADGKLFADVLLLPENYTIRSIIKLQPRALVILADKGVSASNGEATAFFWDYLSLDPYQIENLYDCFIVTSFEYKGTIGCLTNDYGGHYKLKIFDGNEFTVLTRFNDMEASEGGTTIGGIDVRDNEIYIHRLGNGKGLIYKYGNNQGFKNTLDVIAKSYIPTSSNYNVGFVKCGQQYNDLYFSTGLDDGSGATIQYLDTTKLTNTNRYATDGYWYSDLIDMGDERIQPTQITVYFADEFTGGRTISVSLTDRYTNYAIAGLTTLGTVTTTNRIYKAKAVLDTAGTPIPPLDGLGLKLDWGAGAGSSATPIINKIIIDYEPIKIN